MDDEQREFMAVALFWKSKKGYKDDWLYMIWSKRFRKEAYPGDDLIFHLFCAGFLDGGSFFSEVFLDCVLSFFLGKGDDLGRGWFRCVV